MRVIQSLVLVILLLGAVPASAEDTLFARLGGKPGIDRLMADAVGIYMTDPRLHDYFDNINPDWLIPHFSTFICKVAGGDCVYKGRDMTASHKGLHIDERAFDLTVEDLQIAMDRNHIPFWTQNQLLARLAPMERQIVTR